MGTHTLKKCYEDFKDLLANTTSYWLFSRSSITHPESGMKILRLVHELGFPMALFRVQYGNPHAQKVVRRSENPQTRLPTGSF